MKNGKIFIRPDQDKSEKKNCTETKFYYNFTLKNIL